MWPSQGVIPGQFGVDDQDRIKALEVEAMSRYRAAVQKGGYLREASAGSQPALTFPTNMFHVHTARRPMPKWWE